MAKDILVAIQLIQNKLCYTLIRLIFQSYMVHLIMVINMVLFLIFFIVIWLLLALDSFNHTNLTTFDSLHFTQ